MTRIAPIALLLLAGCYAWPRGFLFVPDHFETEFATSCGLEVMEARPGEPPLPATWTLAAVQEVETRALRALATTPDRRFRDGCARLRGWRVVVLSVPAWASPEHRSWSNPDGLISGTTFCHVATIHLGSREPLDSTLPHELAHAIQRCEPVDDGRHYLDQHFGWGPIYDALQAEGLRP